MTGADDYTWWRGATLYQVYPRSFADSNGDGVGDLAGVTARLDHIASLGVDGVWLSPFFRSPMRDFGYDVSDYCDVDPAFGTLDDFDRLIERAHALGLKVIVDQVYAHTSDLHDWFAQSRRDRANARADWYVWADAKPDGTEPNNWRSVFSGPAWTWDARRVQYFFHNFLSTQPALNLHNGEVQDALLEVARFWLDRGVDGFRLDAINFAMHDERLRDNPPVPEGCRQRNHPYSYQDPRYTLSHPKMPAFLERLRGVLDAYPGERFTVAEIGGADPFATMQAYTSGSRLSTAYGFDFLYARRLTPGLVRRALSAWPDGFGAGWPAWAFSNHDAPRAVSRWAAGRDGARAAETFLALLLTLRGNVFLYQGEELGLPQAEVPFESLQDPEAIANWPETLGRDGARTPMPWCADAPNAGFSDVPPWLPVDPRHAALAVDRQDGQAGSMLEFARAMIALRKAHKALRVGDIEFLDAPEGLLAFSRNAGAERLVCVFNLADAPLSWAPPESASVLIGKGEGATPPATLAALEWYVAATQLVQRII